MTKENWKSVWERKGAGAAGQRAYTEDELFALNGYDTSLARINAASRAFIVRNIASALALEPGRSLLEVGCGAGAILFMLRSTGAQVAGVDASASMAEIARRALPGVEIRVAEAGSLPYPDTRFDAVLCHGVFLYFADLAYAAAALSEMLRVCRAPGRLLVGDVPDLAKKEACLSARRAAGASLSPEHLFYPKQFFEDFAAAHSLHVSITDQDVPGYANSPFRFNVCFERN